MPTTDLPGWKLVWSEDFDTDCEEGQFPDGYPTINVYPDTYPDTSKRGRYDPTIISCHGSVLRKRIHTTPDSVHHVAAILPKLSSDGKWGDVTSGRFAVRFRSDLIPTYKMAWLLWPIMGNKDPLMHGEINGPEGGLGGIIKGYMHRKGAPNPGPVDQRVFRSTQTSLLWRTFVIEWIAGVSVTMYLDGVQLGDPETRGVPDVAMHWVLQTETALDRKIPIDPTATGNVEIDWVAVWKPA